MSVSANLKGTESFTAHILLDSLSLWKNLFLFRFSLAKQPNPAYLAQCNPLNHLRLTLLFFITFLQLNSGLFSLFSLLLRSQGQRHNQAPSQTVLVFIGFCLFPYNPLPTLSFLLRSLFFHCSKDRIQVPLDMAQKKKNVPLVL